MKTYKNFTEAYVDLIKSVYEEPEFICAPRGQKIKESLGVKFVIENPRDRLPFIKDRKFSVCYVIAELLWYLTGNNSTEWISNYSAMWSKISDDGYTANSAYGARIFKPHDRIGASIDPTWTQWDYVKNELKKDSDSRRAVIHIRAPEDSLLAKLDVPCTLSLQFFLRDDKLHLVVNMRSSDLIFGIAYDVPAFTLFQELMAKQLSEEFGKEIGLGNYTHVSNSLHIYERHFQMAEDIIANEVGVEHDTVPMPPLPSGDIRITNGIHNLEGMIRHWDNSDKFTNNWLKMAQDTSRDSYWTDWVTILVAHRAGKLGLKEVRKKLIQSTNFDCYHFFDR